MLSAFINRFTAFKAFLINTTMSVSWRDILDATVKVLLVVSLLERQHPFSYRASDAKPLVGHVGQYLSAEQRFRVRIVITHSWSTVRHQHAQFG